MAIVAVLALWTCDSLDNIDVEVAAQAQIARGSVLDQLAGQLAFIGFDGFDVSQSQEFKNSGYSKDQIDSVHIQRFTLSIREPAGSNFDFLSSIRFYAEADGLPRVLVAEMPAVPRGVGRLDLTVEGEVELMPYVVAPSMTLTTEATGTRPAQDTTIDATTSFDVDINVTGACE
jgi:hypothetical protein